MHHRNPKLLINSPHNMGKPSKPMSHADYKTLIVAAGTAFLSAVSGKDLAAKAHMILGVHKLAM